MVSAQRMVEVTSMGNKRKKHLSFEPGASYSDERMVLPDFILLNSNHLLNLNSATVIFRFKHHVPCALCLLL